MYFSGIDECLSEVMGKCYEVKPVNPSKFIADLIYIREGLTVPDSSDDEKDERIYQLEKDLEYYRSLIHSLKTGSDSETKNRIKSIETMLPPRPKTPPQPFSDIAKNILLSNGIKIQIPQMTPGKLIN